MSYQLLNILSILLPLLLSNPTTASLPQTHNTTTHPLLIPSIAYTPPTHKCSKPKFFKTDHRPSWSQCYLAIRTLPSSHDIGTFHNYGANNGYRLPVTESFGQCRAQVEITERMVAVSSWVTVAAALDQLSILCRKHSSQGDRTAGWMLMGPEERIKVSLLGPDDPFLPGLGGAGGGVILLNGTGPE